MAPAPSLDDLVATVVAEAPSDEALDRLAAAATLAQGLTALADELVGHFIDEARTRGCSWAQVGREIGITKQGAHQRHGHPRRGPARGTLLMDIAFGKLELATPRLRMVLAEAEAAAHRRHHNWLGTEHLLEALLALPDSVGARALTNLGVTADAVGRAISGRLPDGAWPPGPVPVTPRVRRVLRHASHSSIAQLRERTEAFRLQLTPGGR